VIFLRHRLARQHTLAYTTEYSGGCIATVASSIADMLIDLQRPLQREPDRLDKMQVARTTPRDSRLARRPA
jgi:hypothetical protein